MPAPEYPITAAVRFLREKGIPIRPHFYSYEEHGGTAHASTSLGINEHSVIKTLVMETEERAPLIVLMHGDREVSTKELARALGTKRVTPCTPQAAQKHTGYQVGGTSPFGTRSSVPVYAEESILSLAEIFVNGGKRGFLISLSPAELQRVQACTPVRVAL